MSSPVQVPFNRGGNIAWPLVLTATDGTPVNITGWTIAIVAVLPVALADNVTCTVTDGPNGTMSLNVAWSEEWPAGEGNLLSIRLKPSGLNEAFPEIQVNLQ